MCLDAEGTFQCSVVIKTTVNATFQNYSVVWILVLSIFYVPTLYLPQFIKIVFLHFIWVQLMSRKKVFLGITFFKFDTYTNSTQDIILTECLCCHWILKIFAYILFIHNMSNLTLDNDWKVFSVRDKISDVVSYLFAWMCMRISERE